MKIAGITITLNDGYKFKEWCQWYEEYKDELYIHIIVDNGSKTEYKSLLKNYFNKSIIIERETNGGCTISYNDGIRKALQDNKVDGILLIGNDIRIKRGDITKLYNFLYSEEKLGIVSPICLMKDSEVVEDFGASITKYLTMETRGSGAGKKIDEIKEMMRFSETVLGGCCLAKPEFYQKVGLQDENLFMYSDEVDTGIRAKECGYMLGYTKEAVAWHQHINPSHMKTRSPFSSYLIARNKVYLSKKHKGRCSVINEYFFFFKKSVMEFIKGLITLDRNRVRHSEWMFMGAFYGLIGNMKQNKYTAL